MSSSGVVQLLTTDGKQDKLLMAKLLLLKRLLDIKQFRINSGMKDVNPSISDIEKTHLLFTNATFKPFVQTTTEYRKEKAPGQYTLGDEVCIEIRHFGDFFSDMILYLRLDTTGMVTYTTAEAGGDNRPLVRWCNYPGERILQKVSFEVNGTEIDEYLPADSVVYRNFHLPINKREVYKKLMGQESAKTGYLTRDHVQGNADGSLNRRVKVNVVDGLQTPKFNLDQTVELWIPLKFWFNMSFKQAIPSVAMPSGQRLIKFTLADANQLVGLVTRGDKCVWDNEYAKDTDFLPYTGTTEADSNASVDYSKLVIKEMSLWVNHLFVQPEIHEIYLSRIGFNLVRVHKRQQKLVTESSEEHKLYDLKWPVETMYVGVKPLEYDDNNATNRARNLDKWDSYSLKEKRYHNVLEKVPRDLFPDYGGVTFAWNAGALNASTLTLVTAGSGALFEVGGSYTAVWKNATTGGQLAFNFVVQGVAGEVLTLKGRHPDYSNTSLYPDYSVTAGVGTILGGDYVAVINAEFGNSPLQVEHYERRAMLNDLHMTLHGVDLFENMKREFFVNYVPYKYGGYYINPDHSDDDGLLMVNFAMHPGQYQPSGHINVSRARDLYLEYTSDVLGSAKTSDSTKTHQGYFHVMTLAINFFLISDGSGILRFIT